MTHKNNFGIVIDKDYKINCDSFYNKYRKNFVGSYLVEPQSGIWNFIYWCNDSNLIKELETNKDYTNVHIHRTHDSTHHVLIELIDY